MSIPTLTTVGGQTPETGYAGQIAEGSTPTIDTRSNDNATAVDFGRAVAAGSSAWTCKPFATYADKIVGISVRGPSGAASTDGNNTVNYPQYAEVPVMSSGRICVPAAENVTAEDDVIAITSGSGTLGGTTGGVANGTTRKTVKGAKWKTTTASGSVGVIALSGVGLIDLTT
jgi:hypothetical protein